MLPVPHVVFAGPHGAIASKVGAEFVEHGRLTHVTSRRALVRVLAKHDDVLGLLSMYALEDGSPLDVIGRFALTRRQGAAVVVVPKTASKPVLNSVAMNGACLATHDDGEIPDDIVRLIVRNMLRFHFEELSASDVPEARELLIEALQRWRRRFGLSELEVTFLRIRACGHSPNEVFRSSDVTEREEALLARIDAASVWELEDRIHREAFAPAARRGRPSADW